MAQVISLDDYRGRRHPRATAVIRLDAAVGRLDALVRARTERLGPTIERELRSIARSVSAGLPLQAADRAERLADILEHPAASGDPPVPARERLSSRAQLIDSEPRAP